MPTTVSNLASTSTSVGGIAKGIVYGHIPDANSIALWRWTGTSPWPSEVNAGTWNTVSETSAFPNTTYSAPGAVKRARGYANNTSQKLQGPTGQAAMSTVFQGEWTIEAWTSVFQQGGDPVGIIFSFTGLGTDTANNSQASIGIVGNADTTNMGKLYAQWRLTSSTLVNVYSQYSVPVGQWAHVAAVKQSVGGGLYSVTLYINGVVAGSATGLTNANGGTSTNMRVAIGGDGNFADVPYAGLIDEIHISNVARSSAYILADAQNIPRIKWALYQSDTNFNPGFN